MEEKNRPSADRTAAGEAIADIVTIVYIAPPDCEFYASLGGFIALRMNGEDKGRVGLYRMRPFSDSDRYVSVRDMDMKEIGIIREIADFPAGQRELIDRELGFRYFMPEIQAVTDIREEYGFTFVTADTDAGKREFSMRDLSNNIYFFTQTKAMLTDTDGNRYLVPDVRKLSDKAQRIIGVWA